VLAVRDVIATRCDPRSEIDRIAAFAARCERECVVRLNTQPHNDVVSNVIAWFARIAISPGLSIIGPYRWNASCSAGDHQRRSCLAYESNYGDAAEASSDNRVSRASLPICSGSARCPCGRGPHRVRVVLNRNDNADDSRGREMSAHADRAADDG